jgi:hypothetical protein
MRPWTERPQEEAYLLNPAFCALLLWRAIRGYHSVTFTGMPLLPMFLVLPVVLHKATREALPRDVRTSLAAWLENNGELRVRFAERAQALVPYVREGLLFGTLHGVISIDGNGRFLAQPRLRKLATYRQTTTDEIRDCISRAEFVAKWFANVGSASTVMALWGVRP